MSRGVEGYPVRGEDHELAVQLALVSALDAGLPVHRIIGSDGHAEAALHLDLPEYHACVTIVITPPIYGAHRV